MMKYNNSQRHSIQSFVKNNISHSKDVTQTSQSIQQMIGLLKQYEKQCQEAQDFSSAEEVKNKIEFLKAQDFVLRRQKFEQEDKQNMQQVSQLGQRQVKQFQAKWEQHFQQVISTLKESEMGLMKQHQQQLLQIEVQLNQKEPPAIKYSAQVLSMRNHLKNLIKFRDYKEAEHTKQNLEKKQREEQQKWVQSFENKKKLKIQHAKKKQQAQLKALRVKLEAIFNEQMKQRNSEFQILLKKNRKRMIETGKINRARLTSKNALLNESRAYSTVSKF